MVSFKFSVPAFHLLRVVLSEISSALAKSHTDSSDSILEHASKVPPHSFPY